jgi:cytochrome P450
MTIQVPRVARSRKTAAFDPLDLDFLDDPYPTYARLRAAGPIVQDGVTQWVVARHEHVARLLRDPRLRSNWPEPFQRMRMGAGAARDFLLRVVLHREGPDHATLRRLLNETMRATPGPVLRDSIARAVDEQVTAALATGRLDVMTDLALPVPVAVACDMLGVPAADRPKVRAWGLEIIKAFTVILPEQDRPAVDEAVDEMRHYLMARLDAGDKLAGIIAAMRRVGEDDDGRDSDIECIDNVIFLLVSGFTTTVHAISTIGSVLLRHPEVYARLQADRSLVRGAIEEFMRYDAPIQHISRFAAEPITIDGQTIGPGRAVHLLLGAANHDDSVFVEPTRIDIRRDPNPHVSFGAGEHACLGAGLARLEATILLDRLLERCATFEADGEPVRRSVQVFRTHLALPARVAG